MHFTYVIQGKAANVAKYLHLNTDHSRLVGLTYDVPMEGFDYLPKSSYARGRNYLYAKVLADPVRSDYYVFIDDDVMWSRGSFGQMERNLERHRPSVGIPVAPKTTTDTRGVLFKGRIRPLVSTQRFFMNDEQYIAVTRAVLEDGKLFPCTEDYEAQSWFVASEIQQAMIQMHYHDTALQFNDCELANDQHGLYPRAPKLARDLFTEHMRRHYPGAPDPRGQFRMLLDLDERSPRNILRFVRDNIRTLAPVRRIAHAIFPPPAL